jgi:hypothetical protein
LFSDIAQKYSIFWGKKNNWGYVWGQFLGCNIQRRTSKVQHHSWVERQRVKLGEAEAAKIYGSKYNMCSKRKSFDKEFLSCAERFQWVFDWILMKFYVGGGNKALKNCRLKIIPRHPRNLGIFYCSWHY